MTDVHCHILPAIDRDGPPRLKDVLDMARIAVSDGIRTIVATPHIKEVVHKPEVICDHVAHLNAALQDSGIPLEILPGAEVSSMLDTAKLQNYTLNGSAYVLLEFPHSHLPQNAGELIFEAIISGLTPIIAHPERNPSVVLRPELLFDLVEAGALVQITAESLTGGFGPDARVCAEYLLKKQAVHFLATDAHSPTWRCPVLSRGLKAAVRHVGEAVARDLVTTNPAAVIAGKPLHG